MTARTAPSSTKLVSGEKIMNMAVVVGGGTFATGLLTYFAAYSNDPLCWGLAVASGVLTICLTMVTCTSAILEVIRG